MRKLLYVLLLMLAPTVGAAREISVASGQHDGFVRLFFGTPEKGGIWEVAAQERQITVTHSAGDAIYDLSTAYRRIGRDLIQEMEDLGSGALAITTACECTYQLVNEPGGSAYLDVFSHDPGRTGFAGERPKLRPTREIGPKPNLPDASAVPDFTLPPANILSQIEEMERTLIFSVTSGIEQNLLLGSSLQTAPTPHDVEPEAPPVQSDQCYPTERYESLFPEAGGDIAGRSSLEPPATLEGPPSNEALLDLARANVQLGLGFEARAMIHAMTSPNTEAELIASIAAIIEDISPPDQTVWRHCDSHSLLWSRLSKTASIDLTKQEATSLFEQAIRLPEPVQRLVAARTAVLLEDAGHHELAALLGGRGGDVQASEQSRLRTASSIELDSIDLSSGSLSDEGVGKIAFPLTDSLAFETRGAPDGDAIEGERFDALLDHGNFAAAMEVLERPRSQDVSRRAQFATVLARDADDSRFLNYSFALTPAGLSARARNEVAARLTALGFEDNARAWRGDPPPEIEVSTPRPPDSAAPTFSAPTPSTSISTAHRELSLAEQARIEASLILDRR